MQIQNRLDRATIVLSGLLANPNNVEALQKSLKNEFQQTKETLKKAHELQDAEMNTLVRLALRYTDALIDAERMTSNREVAAGIRFE